MNKHIAIHFGRDNLYFARVILLGAISCSTDDSDFGESILEIPVFDAEKINRLLQFLTDTGDSETVMMGEEDAVALYVASYINQKMMRTDVANVIEYGLQKRNSGADFERAKGKILLACNIFQKKLNEQVEFKPMLEICDEAMQAWMTI